MTPRGDEWTEVELGQLGSVVTGRTPPKAEPELFGAEYPFFTPSDMSYGDRSPSTERFISEAGAERFRRIRLPIGATCFVCIGATIGKVCLTSQPSFTNQQLNSIIPDAAHHDPRFIYYLLVSVAEEIKALASGAATPIINKSSFSAFKVKVPPLPTQQRIAAILSAYDDLIENNRRRIVILEEMARRLYEEWFVHFRFPGHEAVEFVETERGKVPFGWSWVPLGQMYETSAGGTPSRKRSEFFGGSVRWVKSKELRDAPIFETEEMITEQGLQKSSAKLFPQNSVLIAMYGATIGQLGVLRAEASTNQAVCALLPSRYAHGWAYAFLSLFVRRSELIDLRAGAAQQNVSQAIIKRFPMLLADPETHGSFEAAVKPLLGLSFALHRKNGNLRAQRDLLLPKLVSGEIDVSEAEAVLEAAE